MSSAPANPSASLNQQRSEFFKELEAENMGPLWVSFRNLLTKTPAAREIPYLWPWESVRPKLLRAGELVSTEEAERRVLMFLNPGSPGRIGATATLYAAMQLILPGESARAHRHTPTALRFIVEGSGAFTCVNGEKVFMEAGDLVLTPPMVWHDHGSESDGPVIWLDGLDIPLMLALNCMFFEDHEGTTQPVTAPENHSEKLFGRSLLPAGAQQAGEVSYSPVWNYRGVESREALESLRRAGDPDPFDGYLLRYTNPLNGGEVLNSIGCRLQLLPRGLHTKAHRHTLSTVYHAAEGSGFSILDGTRFDWNKGDTFAVPIWTPHEHAAPKGDAVLFSLNDEPVIRALGHMRTEALTENDGFQTQESVFEPPAGNPRRHQSNPPRGKRDPLASESP